MNMKKGILGFIVFLIIMSFIGGVVAEEQFDQNGFLLLLEKDPSKVTPDLAAQALKNDSDIFNKFYSQNPDKFTIYAGNNPDIVKGLTEPTSKYPKGWGGLPLGKISDTVFQSQDISGWIQRNSDKYSSYVGDSKQFNFPAQPVERLSFTKEGQIIHPITGKPVDINGFPEGTKFTVDKNGITTEIPKGQTIDPAKIGTGNVNIAGEGMIKVSDSTLKFRGGVTIEKSANGELVVKDGKVYLESGTATVTDLSTGNKFAIISYDKEVNLAVYSDGTGDRYFSLKDGKAKIKTDNDRLGLTISKDGEQHQVVLIQNKGELTFEKENLGNEVYRHEKGVTTEIINGKESFPPPDEGVMGLQRSLKAQGIKGKDGKPLKVDGWYGENTAFAVSEFQKKVFPDDPEKWDKIFGPETRQKMFEELGDYSRVTAGGTATTTELTTIENGNSISVISDKDGNVLGGIGGSHSLEVGNTISTFSDKEGSHGVSTTPNTAIQQGSTIEHMYQKYEGATSAAVTHLPYKEGSEYPTEHSYGLGQFTYKLPDGKAGDLPEFLDYLQKNNPDLHSSFEGLTPGTDNFDENWARLADSYPEFVKAQQDFLFNHQYNPYIAGLANKGYDFSGRTQAVQEVLLSGYVQHHGGLEKIISNTLDGRDLNSLSDEEFIKSFYNARTKFVAGSKYESSFAARYPNELKDALKLLSGETAVATRTLPEVTIKQGNFPPIYKDTPKAIVTGETITGQNPYQYSGRIVGAIFDMYPILSKDNPDLQNLQGVTVDLFRNVRGGSNADKVLSGLLVNPLKDQQVKNPLDENIPKLILEAEEIKSKILEQLPKEGAYKFTPSIVSRQPARTIGYDEEGKPTIKIIRTSSGGEIRVLDPKGVQIGAPITVTEDMTQRAIRTIQRNNQIVSAWSKPKG